MQKAAKIFLTINTLLLLGSIWVLLLTFKMHWINSVIFGYISLVFLLSCVALFFKITSLAKILKYLVYIALLALGYFLILAIAAPAPLFAWSNAITIFLIIILIIYLVGFRGYLQSDDGEQYFNQ